MRASAFRAVSILLAAVLATTVGPAVDAGAASTSPSATSATSTTASCAGFHNRVGITRRTITLANVADLSGPVPGLYRSAELAVRAYAAYFNASHSICGRKLRVLGLDAKTDAGADRAAYATACARAFAAVGSIATYDEGGASTAQHCGLPDLRSRSFSAARYACSTCFAIRVEQPNAFANAVPDFFVSHHHAASQAAGFLYLNAGSWARRARVMQKAEELRGMHFLYSSGIDVAEFNYGSYVEQMKSRSVKLVQFVGPYQAAVRLAQAMQQNSFTPEVYLRDDDSYTPAYARFGSAVNGTYVFVDFTPFETVPSNIEFHRYRHWLHVVAPGEAPTPAGLFAWSAARLFTQKALALGGRLTRSHLVAAIRGVHRWTDAGLHARQDVGGKTNGNCWRFLRLASGVWSPLGGTSYLCTGRTVV